MGVRAGAPTKCSPSVCQRLPSPPAPLPQAGEGSKQAASGTPSPRNTPIHPMTPTPLTQPKGNP
ncbi:hypothetical protein CNECB9_4920013 [Cupriavidus necator]|uniref:Uncharacterized protein n=1 Tax=Cupriavidus necator TaxID=106590 RepID=A0A1K0INB5_CUPNE|nr:hypothetical protein CNECB9_4920013 [Cupriavidus necator]